MVCVGQLNVAIYHVGERVLQKALHCALGADGHVDGCSHGSMSQLDSGSATTPKLLDHIELKSGFAHVEGKLLTDLVLGSGSFGVLSSYILVELFVVYYLFVCSLGWDDAQWLNHNFCLL